MLVPRTFRSQDITVLIHISSISRLVLFSLDLVNAVAALCVTLLQEFRFNLRYIFERKLHRICLNVYAPSSNCPTKQRRHIKLKCITT